MTDITMMDTEQVKAFINESRAGQYTLLDVRQPWEYEEFHIPGATLIPLVDLPDRLDELEQGQHIIAYCRSGARSMAASTLLQGQGFSNVTNMVGGIVSWQGDGAYGPMDLGLAEFTGREEPVEVVLKAYAMEDALQRFYLQRSDMAETLERIELFMELAGFEDKHKDTLFNVYKKLGGELDRDGFDDAALQGASATAEGGMDIEAFLEEHGEAFETDHGVLQLAAMVEVQALDFYLRCSRQTEKDETKEVFHLLAREERAHLKLLGRFLDKREKL